MREGKQSQRDGVKAKLCREGDFEFVLIREIRVKARMFNHLPFFH